MTIDQLVFSYEDNYSFFFSLNDLLDIISSINPKKDLA